MRVAALGVWCGAALAVAPSPYAGHGGAVLTNGGVSFRVWAPHAAKAAVAGTFNAWSSTAHPLAPDDGTSNYWSIFISGVAAGAQYKFVVNDTLWRIDPWTREIVYSAGSGNAVLKNPARSWAAFTRPHAGATVLYELHVGTFNNGTFADVINKADYLQRLGVSAVEIMPPAEFNGDRSWGYNPVCPFALESVYGGYDAFRTLVDALHQRGIAVYVDVVYNHIEGEVLWQADGWSMGSHVCGIDSNTYQHGGVFYYDWTGSPAERWHTTWGHNRPNYARPEVTNYIIGNVLYWLREMNCDGIRMDSTISMRWLETGYINETPPFLRALNNACAAQTPGAIIIAEDLQRWDGVTDKSGGGLGFDAQWNDYFVDNIRNEMKKSNDADRDMSVLQTCVQSTEHGRAFATVKYSESHDDAANGQQRLNVEIDSPGDRLDCAGHSDAPARPGISRRRILLGQRSARLDQGQHLWRHPAALS